MLPKIFRHARHADLDTESQSTPKLRGPRRDQMLPWHSKLKKTPLPCRRRIRWFYRFMKDGLGRCSREKRTKACVVSRYGNCEMEKVLGQDAATRVRRALRRRAMRISGRQGDFTEWHIWAWYGPDGSTCRQWGCGSCGRWCRACVGLRGHPHGGPGLASPFPCLAVGDVAAGPPRRKPFPHWRNSWPRLRRNRSLAPWPGRCPPA